MSERYRDLDVHLFEKPDDWLGWLEANFSQSESIWIKFAKKSTGEASITYEEAREAALRYGWIDGQIKGIDETHFLRRFSPRRARSKWSQINREIVEDLLARGLLFTSGLVQVEAARADGRWEAAYAPPSKIEVPEDFKALLEEHPKAAEAFAKLKQMGRYHILYQLHDAKKAETREKRKAQFLAELLGA